MRILQWTGEGTGSTARQTVVLDGESGDNGRKFFSKPVRGTRLMIQARSFSVNESLVGV